MSDAAGIHRAYGRPGLGIWATAVCTVLALLGAAAFPSRGAAQSTHPGDPTRGKQLYFDHACYGCHGFNGETGRPRLAGVDDPILESPDTFVAFLRLRADVSPLLPSASMPSYSVTALSDADARDIYAYVRTFVLNAPDPKSIPALQSIVDSVKPIHKGTR
jgi:mono/diheme cytochrome c family protein